MNLACKIGSARYFDIKFYSYCCHPRLIFFFYQKTQRSLFLDACLVPKRFSYLVTYFYNQMLLQSERSEFYFKSLSI